MPGTSSHRLLSRKNNLYSIQGRKSHIPFLVGVVAVFRGQVQICSVGSGMGGFFALLGKVTVLVDGFGGLGGRAK